MPARTRPLGTITRGTTNPNRLRRFDRWILHRMGPALRAHPDPLVVDLGYGASPVTTVELADRLAAGVGRPVSVLGLEIDPQRVADAQPWSREQVTFARGGFEVSLPDARRPLVIRAANVLRQYDEDQVGRAWASMTAALDPGGVLVEGTCDELGRLASWVTLTSQGPESFTLSVDLRHLERPGQVAERLPKALIHHNVAGTGIHALLRELDTGWERHASQAVFGPRQRWLATVDHLRAAGWAVRDGPGRWRLGELTVPWDAVAPR